VGTGVIARWGLKGSALKALLPLALAGVLSASAAAEELILTEPTVPEAPEMVPELPSMPEVPAAPEAGPGGDIPGAMTASEAPEGEAVPVVREEAGAEGAEEGGGLAAPGAKAAAAAKPDPEEIPLFAEGDPEAAGETAPIGDLSLGRMLAGAAFWLGVVIFVLCAVVYIVKRFVPGATASFRSPAAEVLGRTFLDARKCLYVVKVGRRVLIVASTPERLSTVCEVREPEEVENLIALAVGEPGPAPSAESMNAFRAAIAQEQSRYDVTSSRSQSPEPTTVDELVAGGASDVPAHGSGEGAAMSRIRGEVLKIKQKLQDLKEAS